MAPVKWTLGAADTVVEPAKIRAAALAAHRILLAVSFRFMVVLPDFRSLKPRL